jgi:hypothetical protein
MCYLTLRVVSPPRPFLVVASFRRISAHNYNQLYTQKLRKAGTVPSCTCLRKYSIARGWVCVGYPIPCLGKSEAPLCLGGGLALCVSAGSCGGVVVFDRVTRFCLGGCAASFFLLMPVIVGIVLDRVTRFCLGVGDASFSILASVFVGAVGLDWVCCLISR